MVWHELLEVQTFGCINLLTTSDHGVYELLLFDTEANLSGGMTMYHSGSEN